MADEVDTVRDAESQSEKGNEMAPTTESSWMGLQANQEERYLQKTKAIDRVVN